MLPQVDATDSSVSQMDTQDDNTPVNLAAAKKRIISVVYCR